MALFLLNNFQNAGTTYYIRAHMSSTREQHTESAMVANAESTQVGSLLLLHTSTYCPLPHRLTYLQSNMHSSKQYPGCNHAALVIPTRLPTFCLCLVGYTHTPR